MTMIDGTHSESTVVLRGVTGLYMADFRLEMRHIELDDNYQLCVIDIIMAVTKYRSIASNLPSY